LYTPIIWSSTLYNKFRVRNALYKEQVTRVTPVDCNFQQKKLFYCQTLYQKRNESKLFFRWKISSFSWCISFNIGDTSGHTSSFVSSSFTSIFEWFRTLRTWTACWLALYDFQIAHDLWSILMNQNLWIKTYGPELINHRVTDSEFENHPIPLSFLLHCETMYRSRLDFRCFITSNHTVWSSPNAIFSAVFLIQCSLVLVCSTNSDFKPKNQVTKAWSNP